MELYIIRHGIAVDREDPAVKSDAERWLTEKGIQRMKTIAAGFMQLAPKLDELLTSPYRRAVETAEIVADVYPEKVAVKTSAFLKPPADGHQVLEELRNYSYLSRLALVGHEPDLSQLIALLTAGSSRMDVQFKKGGVCRIDFAKKPKIGEGTLIYLLPPKVFRLS